MPLWFRVTKKGGILDGWVYFGGSTVSVFGIELHELVAGGVPDYSAFGGCDIGAGKHDIFCCIRVAEGGGAI